MMAAWFKADVDSCRMRFLAGSLQCENLGMRLTSLLMPPFSDDLPVLDDDTADTRIGVSGVEAPARKLDRAGHESSIFGGEFASRSH